MYTPLSKLFKSEILWLGAIAAIATWVIIAWSFERGRLQYQMDYEDIITHIDGLNRWRDVSEGGVGYFLTHYLKSPPHCPIHSLMATSAFMLFGVKDWAPYVLNVFLLFVFLLLVRRETRGFGNWPSALAVLGALFVPVSFQSVHQFRPDFPCALATLWGMVFYPRWREEGFGKKAAFSGVLFAVALLSKPPFFPYTLAMGALPWMMAVWEGIREKNSAKGIWGPIIQSWPFFAVTALLAGPHYLVAWKRILEYIELNQFGENAHVWRMTGGLGFQLAYHVFGYSGTFMLGHAVGILLVLVGLGVLLSMIRWGSDRKESAHFLRLAVFTLWAWVFIACNPHMNPFFGLSFQYALVLTGMVAVAWILRLSLDTTHIFRIAAIIPIFSVAVVIWLAFPLPDYDPEFTRAQPEIKAFAKNLPSDVYRKLTAWRPFSDGGYTLLSTYGIVSSHRLQWLANKDRRDFTFYGVPYWTLEKLIHLFRQDPNAIHHVDFVMVTEPGAEGVFEELPNSKTSGGLMEWLKKSESYTQVETILTPSKKKYCLFIATPNFSVFDSMEGLGPKSEPINIEGKPIVRDATASTVILNFDSPTTGMGKMEISLRSQMPVSDVKITCRGKDVGIFPVTPSNDLSGKDFPIPLEKGRNRVEMRIMDGKGAPITTPSLQFGKIRITPPGDASPMSDIIRKSKNELQ